MPPSLPRQLRSVASRYHAPLAWREKQLAAPLRRSPKCGDFLFRYIALPEAATSATGIPATGRLARRSRLEAVLLLAREPLSVRKLAQLANLADGTEARTLLEQLRTSYNERGSAFQVEPLAGGYQLLSRPQFAPWVRQISHKTREIRLSPPAMETLCVVAYRQPVLRAEVEAIRGVGCGEILRQLMDRDLLHIVGRSEELGRPLMYGTTKRFLQMFGLRRLDQLPHVDPLRHSTPETNKPEAA